MEKKVCPWLLFENNELKCVIDMLQSCPWGGDETNCAFVHSKPYDKDLEMKINEIYPAISGEGASTGTVCVIVRTVGCNLRCHYCLVGNTKVNTLTGQKRIQDICVGDKVLACNIVNKEIVPTTVIGVGSREVSKEEVLFVKGGTHLGRLYITKDHPVYVAEIGWVTASELHMGSKLFKLGCVNANGTNYVIEEPVEVLLLSTKQAARLGAGVNSSGGSKESVEVFNITTIQGNFFANRLLVHNCDTQYAYEEGTIRTTQSVVDEVKSYGINTVLLTGGEPLLDPVAASNFLRAMMEEGITVYVETNGAVDIKCAKVLCHIVMDVKTPSSGMHEKMYWRNLGLIGAYDEVKFVVSDRQDYEYAKKIIEDYRLISCTPYVYISPVWSEDVTFFRELSNWMLEDKSTAKLMIQQHKVIWGQKQRGV